jgi:hypothetical protein
MKKLIYEPFQNTHGSIAGLIPIMAVEELCGKICPVCTLINYSGCEYGLAYS